MTSHYIQQLGVAKCREILGGSPDATASHHMYDTYFKLLNPVEWFYWEQGQWKFTSYAPEFKNLLISLTDLRTELSLHDTDDFTHLANHISPSTEVIER